MKFLKTVNYGLMLKKTKQVLTVDTTDTSANDFAGETAHELGTDKEDPIWSVPDARTAEYARLYPTEWYSSTMKNPGHKFNPSDLIVVEIVSEIKEVEVPEIDYEVILQKKIDYIADGAVRRDLKRLLETYQQDKVKYSKEEMVKRYVPSYEDLLRS